jgi:hypothetical protein
LDQDTLKDIGAEKYDLDIAEYMARTNEQQQRVNVRGDWMPRLVLPYRPALPDTVPSFGRGAWQQSFDAARQR